MTDDVTLYDRDPHYIPRVAAVHDMCGYGKCSLTAAIPILSAAGCDVCPVPTALFSAHTKYAVFTFHDTTDILSGYLDAWRKENVELDGVYSGFLGSPDQVSIIQRLYRGFQNASAIPHIRSERNICRMPFTLNLYTDRLKRQSDRCPRFLDLNLHLLADLLYAPASPLPVLPQPSPEA